MKYLVLLFSSLIFSNDLQVYSVCPTHLDVLKSSDCKYSKLPKVRAKDLKEKKIIDSNCKDSVVIFGDRRCLSEALRVGDFQESTESAESDNLIISESLIVEGEDLGHDFLESLKDQRSPEFLIRHH